MRAGRQVRRVDGGRPSPEGKGPYQSQERCCGHVRGDDLHREEDEDLGGKPSVPIRTGTALRSSRLSNMIASYSQPRLSAVLMPAITAANTASANL